MAEEILSVSDLRFVSEIALGKSGAEAARAAGFKSKNAPTKLMRRPEIAAAIEAEKVRIKEHTLYDADRAMNELDNAMAMALETRNPHAYAKAVELRMKLNGLLIERRVEYGAGVDLAKAVSDAKLRVSSLLTPAAESADPSHAHGRG